MIGLFGWPQVTTAAAFVTAVAVVLNPITQGLPDITVPALFPLDSARDVPQAAPSSAGTPALAAPAATPAPVTVAPVRYPAVVAPSNATPPPPSLGPGYIPAPPAVSIAAPPEKVAEIVSIPTGLEIDAPLRVPVVQIAAPPTGNPLAGDRPRTQIARPTPASPAVGNRPLPAAAVDPGSVTPVQPQTPGGPGVQARGRVPASAVGPSVRGHRGPVERN